MPYTLIIERCPETNLYVGYLPNWAGAHTQAESLPELYRNLHEVILLLLTDSLADGETAQKL
jgi:predicted RNase H-like HicB family nuclease